MKYQQIYSTKQVIIPGDWYISHKRSPFIISKPENAKFKLSLMWMADLNYYIPIYTKITLLFYTKNKL